MAVCTLEKGNLIINRFAAIHVNAIKLAAAVKATSFRPFERFSPVVCISRLA